MKNVFVLAEHRQQQLRDTTWDAISAGTKMASELQADLTCLVVGSDVATMAEEISALRAWADGRARFSSRRDQQASAQNRRKLEI